MQRGNNRISWGSVLITTATATATTSTDNNNNNNNHNVNNDNNDYNHNNWRVVQYSDVMRFLSYYVDVTNSLHNALSALQEPRGRKVVGINNHSFVFHAFTHFVMIQMLTTPINISRLIVTLQLLFQYTNGTIKLKFKTNIKNNSTLTVTVIILSASTKTENCQIRVGIESHNLFSIY